LEVRNNVDNLTWCLAGYESPGYPRIVLLSKGTGNVEELKDHLKDDIVAYGLVRKLEQIDNSKTVKFCYVRWIGVDIPRMQRAQLPVHSNPIQRTFQPYHVDIQCERLDEISDSIVENEIAKASGTKINVLENVSGGQTFYRGNQSSENNPIQTTTQTTTQTQTTTPSNPPTRTNTRPKTGSISKPVSSKEGASCKDEESVKEFIRSIRDDSDPTDWCLVTYDAPKSNILVTLAKGSGGINELVSHLNDSIVAYGLYRKSERVDLSVTVKFCFIDWRGENINYMQRAQLGTHSGYVTQLFHPYHVDIQTSDLHDLSEENVIDKITHASGTKNYVLN